MEDKEESITSLGLLSGMTIAAGYAMYFLAMESAGLIAKVQLRALNFVILLIGLLITYRAYRIRLGGRMDYLRGFGMGIFTTVVSTLCFALFLYIYLSSVRPGLLQDLGQKSPFFVQPLNPIIAAFVVMIEGTCSGVIISFVLMQYFRGTNNEKVK